MALVISEESIKDIIWNIFADYNLFSQQKR